MKARTTALQMGLLWVALLAAALVVESNSAEAVTRRTADVAVLYWGIAVAALLLGRRETGRTAWVLACGAYLVHVAVAFDRYHSWSHMAAFEHVESASGFGPGIFVSYAFSLIWLADAAWWLFDRRGYDARPTWLDRTLHSFFAFIVLNGTVVYETGFIRWAGVAMFAGLLVLLLRQRSIEASRV